MIRTAFLAGVLLFGGVPGAIAAGGGAAGSTGGGAHAGGVHVVEEVRSASPRWEITRSPE